MLATILVIVIGVAISSGIAALVGLAGSLLGHSFWPIAVIAFAAQWFISGLWNGYLNIKFRHLFAETEAKNKLAAAYQNVELQCAYCQVPNVTRLAMGKENVFTCQSCNQTNHVNIQVTTMRTNTPIIADSTLKEVFEKIKEQPINVKQNAINTDNVVTDHDKKDRT